jgi:chorismate dehydratase
MKIGRIAYLNVFPYFNGLDERRWGPWVDGTPRHLGMMARRGTVDAAALPVVDTFQLESEFDPLGPWGIASRGPIHSVLLFARGPFEKLTGARILLTADSVTSAALARTLLEEAGNTNLEFETGDDVEGYDGYLAIGDRALRMHRRSPFEHCTDLGEAWNRKTQLPFVFARWVVRKSIAGEERARLETDLAKSLLKPLPQEIPNAAGLSSADARAYLHNIVYKLDDECLAGLELFRERVYAHV